MARKALIDIATNKVLNVIEAGDNYAQVGCILIPAEGIAVSPGDLWDGVKFIPRPPSAEDLAAIKREEARIRAMDAIKANQATTPWGRLLKDLAISQGWIEE